MRLLIAKLASASVQSVSVALNSETDVADLATDLDSCVRLLRGGGYDLVLLIVSHTRLSARDAVARLRREAGHVPMVVLTEPGHDGASVGGALAGASFAMQAVAGQDAASGIPASGNRGARLPAELGPDGEMEAGEEAGIATPWMWDEPPLPNARGDRAGAGEPGAGGGIAMPETTRARTHHRRSGARRIAVDLQSESLRVDDQVVALSQAEFRIFARLWESRGRIVSAEDLMGAIYLQGERPASRVLPVFLFKLRRKLTPVGLGDLVETAIGRGFTIRSEAEAEAHA